MKTKLFSIKLQLFNDGINTVAGLDSLLAGNTPPQTDAADAATDADVDTASQNLNDTPATDGAGDVGGGPDNLDSPKDTDPNKADNTGDGLEQERARQNAAFAKLRAESAQANKLINELARALGIQENDPALRQQKLLSMAQEKLAKDSNVPVELYKELNYTKEQLAYMQAQQNQITARDKFMQLKTSFELSDQDLMAFAKQLDEQGISVVQDPGIDLEYHYYKMNRQALEQKRIQQAVEEALRKSNAADTNSTTPPKQQSKGGGETPKVNSVSALDLLLAGK